MNKFDNEEIGQTFLYEIELSKEDIQTNDKGESIIYYKGEERVIDGNIYNIQFGTDEMITMDEALNMIRGTKGIISIKGTFKY